MNNHTLDLLKECSSGCQMAIQTIRQIKEYTREQSLELILNRYEREHALLNEEINTMLSADNKTPKEPGKLASAMAWTNIEFKMLLEADSHQIAKVMMDGCNMGIQSVSEYKNKYNEADSQSVFLAEKLIRIEEEFMKELRAFI